MQTRMSNSEISEQIGISRFTLYRYLEKIQPATTERQTCQI